MVSSLLQVQAFLFFIFFAGARAGSTSPITSIPLEKAKHQRSSGNFIPSVVVSGARVLA
jgi:hypothetical protein